MAILLNTIIYVGANTTTAFIFACTTGSNTVTTQGETFRLRGETAADSVQLTTRVETYWISKAQTDS